MKNIKLMVFIVSFMAGAMAAARAAGPGAGDVSIKGDSVYGGVDPSDVTVAGKYVYYTLTNSSHNRELWRTDGTRAGTVMLKEIQVYGTWQDVCLTAVGDGVIFGALQDLGDAHSRWTLWKTDGTRAGTLMLSENGPERCEIANAGTRFFTRGGSLSNGVELWKTDGTQEGTSMLKKFSVGNYVLVDFAAVGKLTFFSTLEKGGEGSGLWKTDGTSGGTVWVKDFGGCKNKPRRMLAAIGTALYFDVCVQDGGEQLWKTDGSAVGTQMLKVVPSRGYGNFVVKGETLFFGTVEGLWKTDGSTAGTKVVAETNPGGRSFVSDLYLFHDAIYFSASNDGRKFQFWKTDGATEVTSMVKGSRALGFTPLDGSLYFGLAESGHPPEVSDFYLWKTDDSGPVRASDVKMGSGLGVNGHHFYFVGDDGVHGFQLWKSDGTRQGTSLLKVIDGSGANPRMESFTAFGDLALFSALDSNGHRLWRTDGTSQGTFPINGPESP